MRKNTLLFIALAIIACFYTWLKFRPSPDIKELLKPRVFNMDPDGSQGKRYTLYFQIDSLLLVKSCEEAEQKIDSALSLNEKDVRLVDFKGQVLLCKGDAKESIAWFNKAMQIDGSKFPRALGHRAEAYCYLKKFDSAIVDLKECAEINFDYTKDLGKVYEKVGQKDSAIKYYQIFLDNYPDSINVQKSLFRLKTSG